MTGDGDRLDEIERTARYLRLCDLLPHTLWLVRELRDARAENERLGKQMTGTVSMLAAERAKVERVRALRTEWAQRSAEDRNHELWRALGVALAGDEE